MIDVDHQISSVDRQIGSRTLEAGEARTLTVSRVYDTRPEDLWDACTDPERIARWFLPLSGDLRPGGRYEFQGNASGTIERCEPPHSLVATWEYGGQISCVELRLTPEPDGQTRFELEHIAHVDDDRWAQFGPGAVGIGWDQALVALTLHLSSEAEPPEREDIEAWRASDDGRQHVRLSSERWAEASIAAGTDPAEAHAAAGRTTDFYTGEPAA
jgi:uncharacterized protein YndB with AHSA1/START domain